MSDLTKLTIADARKKLRAKEIKAAEIADAYLGAIERANPVLNAYIAVTPEKAREKGISRLVLETGEAPGFEAAYRVYERGGFTVCGRVLDYPDSGFSRFYEKKISP